MYRKLLAALIAVLALFAGACTVDADDDGGDTDVIVPEGEEGEEGEDVEVDVDAEGGDAEETTS